MTCLAARRRRCCVAAALVLTATIHAACGPKEIDPEKLAGRWRAVIDSPGGELPFGLRFELLRFGRIWAAAINGEEEVPFTTVKLEQDRLVMGFDHLDSQIEATVSPDGSSMEGFWVRQAGRQRPQMRFRATRGGTPRFGEPPSPAGDVAAIPDVAGAWDVVFVDDEKSMPARGELRQAQGSSQGAGPVVTGTFLTPEGDYRYLEGDYRDGVLRLSCFDGGHAFLFVARARPDGTLAGDFWSRSSYHATWTARRPADGATPRADGLPDPFGQTVLTSASGRLRFSFPDTDGRTVSSDDPRFAGKVLLVDIFGSWCPNCNDQAPLLVDLYRRYHPRGLEIVGLAYEMTGDPRRDAVFVKRFAQRYGIGWPLLLAGTSDKAEASATLPDLSGVLAFPTLVFVGRDGGVKAIHTGFAGPGTGRHHEELKAEYVRLIESLL